MDNDPNESMKALWASIRALLIALGGALLTAGFTITSPVYFWVMFLSGAITVVGPLGWSAYLEFKHVLDMRKMRMGAMQAGINLVTSGGAVTADGKRIIAGTGDGGVAIPLAVTAATASQIMKNYAPLPAMKAA